MLLNEELELKAQQNTELTTDNTLLRDEYLSLNIAFDKLQKDFSTIKVSL